MGKKNMIKSFVSWRKLVVNNHAILYYFIHEDAHRPKPRSFQEEGLHLVYTTNCYRALQRVEL